MYLNIWDLIYYLMMYHFQIIIQQLGTKELKIKQLLHLC